MAKRKKILAALYGLILAICIISAGIALGLAGRTFITGPILAAVGFATIAGCAAANVVYNKKFEKALSSATVQGLYDDLQRQMAEVRADVEKAKRRVAKNLRLAVAYNLLLLAATFLIIAGLNMVVHADMIAGEGEPLSLGVKIAMMAVIDVVLYKLFGGIPAATLVAAVNADEAEADRQFGLEIAEYPLLYELAESAAKTVGCNLPFVLCRDFEDCDVSVSEYGGTIAVFLPPTETAIMSESELRQILLHEFAHVKNSDTKWLNKFNNAKKRYAADGKGVANFFKKQLFSIAANRIEQSVDNYINCSSLLVEQRADEAVKRCGNPQEFINASAKGMMLSLFFAGYHPETDYLIYESEQPVNDLFARKRELFEKELPLIYPRLKEVAVRTLAGKNDTHPTLRQRMEAMGIENFDVFCRPEGKYLDEINEYIRECGEICAGFDGYEEFRQQNYLNVKQRLDKFENSVAEGKPVNEYMKWSALYDYMRAAPESGIKLADQMLAENPHDPHAAAVKGLILSSRNEDGGIELLRTAIEYGGAPQAAKLIGAYANAVTHSGDEKLLDELRAEQLEITQKMLNGFKAIMLNLNQKPPAKVIMPCRLPQGRIEKLRQVLKAHGGALKRVFVAEYMRNNFIFYVVGYSLAAPYDGQNDEGFFDYLYMLSGPNYDFCPYALGKDKLSAAIMERGIELT